MTDTASTGVFITATHADHLDVVPAAGTDDLEEVQFTVQPLVLLQTDDQRDVLEEPRRLVDLFPEVGLELVVIEVIELKGCQRDVRALELETLLYPGAGSICHEGVSSLVSGAV